MGQTEFGPRPRIATAQPKRSDSDRLDQIIALLSEVRDLLQHSVTNPPSGHERMRRNNKGDN